MCHSTVIALAIYASSIEPDVVESALSLPCMPHLTPPGQDALTIVSHSSCVQLAGLDPSLCDLTAVPASDLAPVELTQ